MKMRKINILIILFCLIPLSIKAKSGIETSLFTGSIYYTIPIYTLEDADFHLDISLSYNGCGFKPFHPSGFYGQDWSLLAGGSISRVVQGFPDEQKIEYLTGEGRVKDAFMGMHHALDEGCIFNKDSVFYMSSSVYAGVDGLACQVDQHGANWWDIDYMPDIFSYNFMGHIGSFIINNQGEVMIISGDYIDVDFSQWTETHDSNYYEDSYYVPSTYSKITIKTTDCYTYVFGGNKESLEYSVRVKPDGSLVQEVPVINKWNITAVIAPNNRAISFQYKQTESGHPFQCHFFSTNYDWSGNNIQNGNDTTNVIYILNKSSIPATITTLDSVPLNVSFFSSEEQHKMYEHPTYTMCHKNFQLDSISISCDNRTLTSAHLSYLYRRFSPVYGANNYYWRYLSSIWISGKGSYNLSYNHINPNPESAPPFLQEYTYPSLYTTTDAAYISLVDRSGFWNVTSLQGMLSKVTLPTGGNIRFTYGNHDYREERRFQKVGSSDVELYALNTYENTIGGARIEKIEIFSDDTTLVKTQTFSYCKPETTLSSGIYYNIYDLFYSSNESLAIVHPNNYSMIDSHIGYSSVQRTTTIENISYKTNYLFHTGHSAYSSSNLGSMINHNYDIPGYTDSAEIRSGSLTYHPQLIRTGKLLATKQYNGNGSLQQVTYYRYNGITDTISNLPNYEGVSLGSIDTIVCLSSYSGHIARKLVVAPNMLEQVITYEFGNNPGDAPLISSVSYTYDSKLRKKQIAHRDSRGVLHFTRYTYPDDISSANGSALKLLIQSHRINHPIERISGFINGDAEYITSGTAYIYSIGATATVNPNNQVQNHMNLLQNPGITPFGDSLPSWQGDSVVLGEIDSYYPYLYQVKSLALAAPILDRNFDPIRYQNWNMIVDSHYKLTCEYFYNIHNRMLSVKPYGKIETRYTWNGIYPVSKTTGDQTWTYTYIPYVGISSMTDPRGLTTCYTYDSVGRLVEVYQIIDGRKRILNAYQYHIKTE
jgi:hypothetical protein